MRAADYHDVYPFPKRDPMYRWGLTVVQHDEHQRIYLAYFLGSRKQQTVAANTQYHLLFVVRMVGCRLPDRTSE